MCATDRARFRRRLAATVLGTCVALALVVSNIRGCDRARRPTAAEYAPWVHGWPLTWLRRNWVAIIAERGTGSSNVTYSPVGSRRWLSVSQSTWSGVYEFDWEALLLDALIAAVITTATVHTTHRWLVTPRRRLQFSIRTLLLMPVVVAAVFALWHPVANLLELSLLVAILFGVICTCSSGLGIATNLLAGLED